MANWWYMWSNRGRPHKAVDLFVLKSHVSPWLIVTAIAPTHDYATWLIALKCTKFRIQVRAACSCAVETLSGHVVSAVVSKFQTDFAGCWLSGSLFLVEDWHSSKVRSKLGRETGKGGTPTEKVTEIAIFRIVLQSDSQPLFLEPFGPFASQEFLLLFFAFQSEDTIF